ncbi:MAG: translation initiation factor IF-2 subunit gamma [Candidatus Heimdallarchaeota archaeon]
MPKKQKKKSSKKKSKSKAISSTKLDLKEQPQAEVSIGTIGHVDHGKSTLVEALTGRFPDTHSEELRRGISIRLGYATCEFRKCPSCEEPDAFTTEKICPKCQAETELLRRVAFVDAPGHEILMATMLSGAAIMDGAILVISANEKCPMPQTREHLAAIEIVGLSNILVAQNKIELVDREVAVENFNEISDFLSGTTASEADIIPISAVNKANLDALIQEIEQIVPTPSTDQALSGRLLIARSFDVNKPGYKIDQWSGGVIGGVITQGTLSVGEEIEIRPGIKRGDKWQPILTEISSLQAGFGPLEIAAPGGLVGVGTKLDPALTKSDKLVGHVAGKPDTLPPTVEAMAVDVHLLEEVLGSDEQIKVAPIETGEPLMLNVGTSKTIGVVTGKSSKEGVSMTLRLPICAEKGMRAAISRRIDRRWRLIGWGFISSI